MSTKDTRKVNINGINVDIADYKGFCAIAESSLINHKQTAAGYANANSINFSFKDPSFAKYFEKIDIVHPDGIGMNYALKQLSGNRYPRFSGSDAYPYIIELAVKHNAKVFFLGHDDDTLKRPIR